MNYGEISIYNVVYNKAVVSKEYAYLETILW